MSRALRYLVGPLALALSPLTLSAQYITLKTVPIPAGEQFLLFPSHNLGMGSVHIALDDPLLDPFANPARGARIERMQLFALPTLYGETNDAVGGRSLPIAALIPGRRVHAAFAFALQQVDGSIDNNRWWIPAEFAPANLIQDNSSTNVYLFGSLGTRFNRGRTSLGLSVYHADLEAVDVVDMLYARAFAIEQSGSMTEARLGLTHDLGEERTLDVVIANNLVDMSHDVWYFDWNWQRNPPVSRVWNELNEDRTSTWAAHARYTHPFAESARFGAIFTANTKAHPKIPNYNLVNIPRDPGNSAAFNIGVGVSNAAGASRFGMELMYEPARSHTWAYADTVTQVPGGVLNRGDRTVDNQFRFRNWNLGVGLEREGNRHGFQLGLRLRQIRYTLDQQNFLTATRRKTREDWMEWTPSWSYVLKFPAFDVRYAGRFTARGWPDTNGFFGLGGTTRAEAIAPGSGTDFIIGPTEPVNLPEFRVTTHRVMVSIPFRLSSR